MSAEQRPRARFGGWARLGWSLAVVGLFATWILPPIHVPGHASGLPTPDGTGPGWQLRIADPRWLALTLFAPLPTLIHASRTTLVHGMRRWWVGLTALRVALLGSVGLALSAPTLVQGGRVTHHAILADVSASVDDPMLEQARSAAQTWTAKEPRPRASLWPSDARARESVGLRFARSATPTPLDSGALWIQRGEAEATPGGTQASDLAGALALAAQLAPVGARRQISILTDGAFSPAQRDRLERIIPELLADGVALRLLPLRSAARRNVAVRAVQVPRGLRVGRTFDIEVTVDASGPGMAQLTLLAGDQPAPMTDPISLRFSAGATTARFTTRAVSDGPLALTARLDDIRLEQGDDMHRDDDALTVVRDVRRRPRVLAITSGADAPLPRALDADALAVTTRTPTELVADDLLARPDLIVLDDVVARDIPTSTQRRIAQLVDADGVGLMLLGGPNAFGPGGWQGTPIDEVSPVFVEGRRQRERPGLALMLVIDKSGSMSNEDKLELVKDAARAAANALQRDDQIGVIAFDSRPSTLVPLQSAAGRVRIGGDIRRVRAGGGTNVLPALREAYLQLAGSNARVKHVIVLSDGQSPERGVDPLVQRMRDADITVSSVGVGSGAGKALLRRIARGGGGRYYFSLDGRDVPSIFRRETREAAQNAAVEERRRVRTRKRIEALAGVDVAGVPALDGIMPVRPRPLSEVILETDRGEPLLVRGRYGLGRTYAFAADTRGRWTRGWPRWRGFAKLWSQLARDAARPGEEATAGTTMEVVRSADGTRDAVIVDVRDGDRWVNDLSGEIALLDPLAGDEVQETFPTRQIAPGRYTAVLPAQPPGAGMLEARLFHAAHDAGDRSSDATPLPAARAVASLPTLMSSERAARVDGSPDDTLSRLEALGVQILTSPETRWPANAAEPAEIPTGRPAWPLILAWLTMPLFILDLAARRLVAWGGPRHALAGASSGRGT